LFDRKKIGERATLVYFSSTSDADNREDNEFMELSIASGANLVGEINARFRYPNAKYLIGKGKIEELQASLIENKSDLIIFNTTLSPSQEKNLEKKLSCRVIDRTGLILDIFAQRARSFEGKLQVELAQLRHISTRLIRGWTHLERQKGGIGLRGPGETQLETDRRLINKRIKQLKARLDRVDKRRKMNRKNRSRAGIPTVAIVGYTNAGKSTLFNQLTGSSEFVKDQLFATLDPVMRRLDIKNAGPIILSDTVGFIRDLPHDLVAAFKATLQEAKESDLILHTIDASDPDRLERIGQVNRILGQLDASNVPQIRVYNKIDKNKVADIFEAPNIEHERSVWLSAKTGQGIEKLNSVLANFLKKNVILGEIKLHNNQGRQRAKLFQMGAVKTENIQEDGSWNLILEIKKEDIYSFLKKEGISKNNFSKI
jgi:GTP-binding protein HflX